MALYSYHGATLENAYIYNAASVSEVYDYSGHEISFSTPDYNIYDTEYQHAILQARDAWKTQYRADNNVVPIVLHTDQHGRLTTGNMDTILLFNYLSVAIKWNETSACIGLGDVDLTKENYFSMDNLLKRIPTNKRIDIWGNHDLWNNYTTMNNQYVVDFDTIYPYFNNESYGDESFAYNHKGIEYHIDEAHNIKYVCIAGWEIDKSLGGDSHYIIGQQSMDDIIDMLEMKDGYDIVILSHCTAFTNGGNKYTLCSTDNDTFYNEPVISSGALTNTVDFSVALDAMLSARNNKTSGTITDAYGNVHSYDFTNCTGNIICNLIGHGHCDIYGYSLNGGILTIMYDAFAYNTNPFYMINIDRTKGTVDGWKITTNAVVQNYTIPLKEVSN